MTFGLNTLPTTPSFSEALAESPISFAHGRNAPTPGLLERMAHRTPPFWQTSAFFAAVVVLLYVFWGPY